MSEILPFPPTHRPGRMDPAQWEARKRGLEARVFASLREDRDENHRGPFGLRALLVTVGATTILWLALVWALRSAWMSL